MHAAPAKRILVTGGAGFVGSHLCEALIADGHHVICLDNFLSGTQRNIAGLSGNPRFELLHTDVCDAPDIDVDEVFNLACPASPLHYQRDPVLTTRTCVLGALRVLDLAKRCNARILQASTSEIYGDPQCHPQAESYWGHVNPIGTRACYNEGKRCAETLFFDYARQYGVRIKVARLFNTYGPRMDPADGRVVANFIVQALKNDSVTIFGDGRQTRSFCFVSDIVDGMRRLMAADDGFTGPLNLGNPAELDMLDLARQIIDLTGSASKLVFHPLPGDDPRQRRPDISLAVQTLGWQPDVALNAGLLATIAYFNRRLQVGFSGKPARG